MNHDADTDLSFLYKKTIYLYTVCHSAPRFFSLFINLCFFWDAFQFNFISLLIIIEGFFSSLSLVVPRNEWNIESQLYEVNHLYKWSFSIENKKQSCIKEIYAKKAHTLEKTNCKFIIKS